MLTAIPAEQLEAVLKHAKPSSEQAEVFWGNDGQAMLEAVRGMPKTKIKAPSGCAGGLSLLLILFLIVTGLVCFNYAR